MSSYLFQAVQNACLNYLKHQSVHQDYISKAILELKVEELTMTSPEIYLINREQLDQVYQAVDNLPEKCREIFILSYMEGKKNVEIAKILQLSIRTVENQLYRALKILRENLSAFIFVLLFGSL
ncbi:MAG: sigma-70 family RNA polymerase sigma factor [Tannerellaceae bacterium]|nr:sigma-70 family RNA polymerase sigma factor [Tannerellaceae bacterium]